MRVLVTQHHPDEGPGLLGDFLASRGAELVTIHAHAGQLVPRDPAGFDALLSLGGPMNVYEEREHPWLVDENVLLANAAKAGMPVLGICLGAQLIAKALGAAVTKAPVEEVGWRTVRLTPAGAADPLLAGLGPEFTVLQWHGDTFALPEGGRLLATGEQVAHQAFAWGRAYGLQFHVEATPEIVRAWFPRVEEQAPMLEPFTRQGAELSAQAERIFGNFVALAAGR
jgi:GMP synthase-like glutamine amidotransferase